MPTITLKADTLDEETRRFAPSPLRQSLFLNSIPKSGTHLLMNILRMFVPLDQQYRAQFIQWGNLQQHLAALDPARRLFSHGHLFFSDSSAIELAGVRHVLLCRDPYDWVLARARFFLSDEFEGNVDFVKEGRLGIDELLTLMIFGIHTKSPSMADMYDLNVVAWLGSPSVHLVRYEELVAAVKDLESDAAEAYFGGLFGACGIDVPGNWRERVRVGADRRQSGTARENLSGSIQRVPSTLPERHRKLVDYASPSLRAILGYV
ncbi:hypothetical protein ABDK56_02255 [Sphingomonas sp. ASV193]|uniref:hypothetical protein n=1 Tax=Sphingomonas sp. ASV193 TaxID=3144405 RepID=UPI0032E91215